MFYDQGCIGRVELGPIPEELSERLCAVPGEWLEYDPPSGAVVVRHVEPTSSRHLPAIVHELVRIFAEIPPELHSTIPGGDLFVHTAVERGQLVRVRVEPGGAIRIQWAHPNFKRALRRPYAGGSEIVIDPEVQQLNGTVAFRTQDPHGAARALEELLEGFEGLYPVGNCGVRIKDEGSVELTMEETNLEAALLVDLLQKLAEPRSLSGRFELSSFGTVQPVQRIRFVFEEGKIWVQHPLLWVEKDEPMADEQEPRRTTRA
jgi:hypothetical protein